MVWQAGSSFQIFGINAKDPFRYNRHGLDQSSASENQHLARRRVELRGVKDHPAIRLQDRLPDQWLAANKGSTKMCAATVSPSKSARFKPVLGQLDVLIANRAEAHVLTGIEINELPQAKIAIELLRGKGIPDVVITMGAKGVVSSSNSGTAFWHPLPTKLRDVNGAGDAFYSGFLSAFSKPDTDIDDAVACGLAMASLTAETDGTTVWNLSQDAVATRAAQAEKTPL